jgi:hypothetical protein
MNFPQKSVITATILIVLASPLAAFALAELPTSPGEVPTPTVEPPAQESIQLEPPFGQERVEPNVFIQQIIGRVIRWALGITGSIALLMFVYGGFLWLTSGGRDDKIDMGKKIIVWSSIGLVVIFMSYAITSLVLRVILGQ